MVAIFKVRYRGTAVTILKSAGMDEFGVESQFL
jgi:hypothetical protein